MLRVTKCCCCCSLKYGYYTFGIICLMLRVCSVLVLYNASSFVSPGVILSSRSNYAHGLIQIYIGSGYIIGWLLATIPIFYTCLKGIVQKRSMLMYPTIAVLIVELLVVFIFTVIVAITVTPWALLSFAICAAINIYALICLISLYHEIKDYERRLPKVFESHSPMRV